MINNQKRLSQTKLKIPLQLLVYLYLPLFQTLEKTNIPFVSLAQPPFIALPLSAFKEEMPPQCRKRKSPFLFFEVLNCAVQEVGE